MNGRAIYASQAVAANKDIIVRLLGFDPTTGAVRLAIDEVRQGVGPHRITATFGSGTSVYVDYDGRDANKDNRPILTAPKQYDTLNGVTVGPMPPPRKKESIFRPEKAWGTSARKSKQLARDAQEKMRDTRQNMEWHKQSCSACKAAFAEI